jgi:hypothetical protein
MIPSRRAFLRGTTGALALAAADPAGLARAAAGLTERTVRGGPSFKILEIFFSGGLSHRESLWVEQPEENPPLRKLGTLDPKTHPLLTAGAPADWLSWLPARGDYLLPEYRVRSTGRAVHLGPCAAPLVRSTAAGPALLPRLRVLAMGHSLPEHGIARALMLQGAPALASEPRSSGVGAAIARHTGLPSFVFYDSEKIGGPDAALAAVASGNHGAAYAPFRIPYNDPDVLETLVMPRNSDRDNLARVYTSTYEDKLVFSYPGHPATGARARSRAFEAYVDAQDSTFDGPLLTALSALTASSGNTLWDNPTRRAIQASVRLLSLGGAGYCCVVDTGVVRGLSYDTHSVASFEEHAALTTGHVLNVLRTLREEIDAGRLDLGTTLVVLNTEFGRSFSELDLIGTDHCHEGFAVAVLGGPVSSGAVVGDLAFNGTDDSATREVMQSTVATGTPRALTPTDLRAALLQAAGILPVQTDTYTLADLGATGSTPEAASDTTASLIFGT